MSVEIWDCCDDNCALREAFSLTSSLTCVSGEVPCDEGLSEHGSPLPQATFVGPDEHCDEP